MQRKKYSAGAVKLSFWFPEFRKAVQFLSSGATFDDIKQQTISENFFGASISARGRQICTTVLSRIQSLDDSFYPLFMTTDLTSQKMFDLASIMTTDSLFFDFVYEVVREKMIIGTNELSDSDVRIFFSEKQHQSDIVAKWTDETITRLGKCYKTMLYEAGILDKSYGTRKIIRPLLDLNVSHWLDDQGMEAVKKALLGER